ncbi:hypothetical protein D9757_002125 [Collybiopsis confluens]|uniref:Copper-fist domain-containing protein n=1 Tax=Collybiopsis confluens TaxID=2823264 RepID=A0A8H5I078_9AGAR|nr:hypothetical protein D9757_002125 [Collybiopsis confluens]
MVFVNSKKFACESCIKGHRSSSCSHTDRPLFEVKKKGRPVSQCDQCRELRQSKKVHSKCNCNSKEQDLPKRPIAPGKKPPRFIPIAPALPNGIKDVIQVTPASSNSRQRMDVLLNPCSCKKPSWNCKCVESPASQSSRSSGLETLACAAELYSSAKPPNAFRRFARSPSPDNTQKHPTKHPKLRHDAYNTPGPELAPLFLFDESSPGPYVDDIPDFDVMPPIQEIASLAGSGCTCGIECGCPGCVEHRGAENADPDYPNPTKGGCGMCVDNLNGIGLPSPASSLSLSSPVDSILGNASSTSRMIDRFFARAAALPSPPVNRKMQLDPGNVMVYPSAAMETKERGVAFGLITIPKLECCGGNCGCPAGSCTCGKSCDGCCAEHLHEAKASSTTPSFETMAGMSPVTDGLTAVRVISAPVVPVRSSCCSK